jgi:hypothetical protein
VLENTRLSQRTVVGGKTHMEVAARSPTDRPVAASRKSAQRSRVTKSCASALDQRFISGLLRETPMLSRVLEEETAESIRLTNRIAIDHRQLSKHARLYHRRGVARRDRDLGHRRDLGRAGR